MERLGTGASKLMRRGSYEQCGCLAAAELPGCSGTTWLQRNCLAAAELPGCSGTTWLWRNCLAASKDGVSKELVGFDG